MLVKLNQPRILTVCQSANDGKDEYWTVLASHEVQRYWSIIAQSTNILAHY